MTSAEFQSQYARLRNRFGERHYDQDFSILLWRDLKDYADGSFTTAVDAIVGEHFKPIGKSAIIEITRQESQKIRGSQPQHTQHASDDYKPRSPWPKIIEGLMLCFEDHRYAARGIPSRALIATGLKLDEAEYLYKIFKAQDFKNEWAIELVERSISINSIGRLREGFGQTV